MNCKIVEFFLKKFRGKWTFFDPNIFILREKEKRFRHEIAGVIMVDETISITGRLSPPAGNGRIAFVSPYFPSFLFPLYYNWRNVLDTKERREKRRVCFEENIRSGETCINPILFPHEEYYSV